MITQETKIISALIDKYFIIDADTYNKPKILINSCNEIFKKYNILQGNKEYNNLENQIPKEFEFLKYLDSIIIDNWDMLSYSLKLSSIIEAKRLYNILNVD